MQGFSLIEPGPLKITWRKLAICSILIRHPAPKGIHFYDIRQQLPGESHRGILVDLLTLKVHGFISARFPGTFFPNEKTPEIFDRSDEVAGGVQS